MKVLHSLRADKTNGQLVTLLTKCGSTFYRLDGEQSNKTRKERTTEDPEKVTCKSCLRSMSAPK